jgi:hypothetical protein
VLAEDGDDDVGIAARGHADEPGVGAGVTGEQMVAGDAVVDDLGGSGLAGEVDAFEVGGGGGAGGGGRGHGVGDGLPVGGGDGDDAVSAAGEGGGDGRGHLGGKLIGEDDVGALAPWPMPTEMASPAYHFSWKFFIFHAVEGMVPVASSGRSTPVFWPRPTSVAYLAMVSMPSFSARA